MLKCIGCPGSLMSTLEQEAYCEGCDIPEDEEELRNDYICIHCGMEMNINEVLYDCNGDECCDQCFEDE
jgi:hypothetical protein